MLKGMYDLDVNTIANLIISTAKSYENTDGYSKELSLKVAMSDYSFWYNDSDIRLKELEKILN